MPLQASPSSSSARAQSPRTQHRPQVSLPIQLGRGNAVRGVAGRTFVAAAGTGTVAAAAGVQTERLPSFAPAADAVFHHRNKARSGDVDDARDDDEPDMAYPHSHAAAINVGMTERNS